MLVRSKYYKLFFIVVFAALFSCGKDSACLKGSGKKITEQLAITDEVTSIIIGDKINLVITQSNEPSLMLEGGENLLPYINMKISGKELTISSDNKCGFLRDNNKPLTAYISIPNLTRIEYTGHGTITNTGVLNLQKLDIESFGGTGSINLNLNVENFTVGQHSAPADFTFTGTAKNARVYTIGNGWFYMKDFTTETTHVNHAGIGDVIVNVTNRLSIELRSRGNVNYYGNPIVSVSPNVGSGKVIKK